MEEVKSLWFGEEEKVREKNVKEMKKKRVKAGGIRESLAGGEGIDIRRVGQGEQRLKKKRGKREEYEENLKRRTPGFSPLS